MPSFQAPFRLVRSSTSLGAPPLSGFCYADHNVCHMTGRPCPSREACGEAQSGCGGGS